MALETSVITAWTFMQEMLGRDDGDSSCETRMRGADIRRLDSLITWAVLK